MTTVPDLDDEWFPLPLPENVAFADRSTLYATRAFLHFRSTRPCGLRVGEGTSVYDPASFVVGPHGSIEIGASCIVTGWIAARGRVVIGDNVLMGVGSAVSDDDYAAPHEHGHDPPQDDPDEPSIVVGDLAFLGARSVVLAGARIGTGAIIGAGTVVRDAVPDYAVLVGNPPRIVGWSRPKAETA